MNIDFHYGVVYVVSRLGGLSTADATTVAHACQYVDDATTSGLLYFSGGETFERFATAHKLFDYENLINEGNRLVWTPFHFLPGGEGQTLEERAICRPNSEIAQAVVKRAIAHKGASNALHRLGVTLHTYVDTWAHQRFAGIECASNKVRHLEAEDCTREQWLHRFANFMKREIAEMESDMLSDALPLGHGAALHYPDQPWAKWNYVNGHGEHVHRENLGDFVTAAEMACRAVQGYCAGNQDFMSNSGLSPEASAALRNLLDTNRNTDEIARLKTISDSVAAGTIPGLREQIPTYIGKGAGSWKHLATGIKEDGDGHERPAWSEGFEESDYRKFHDAVKEHRAVVTQDILPAHKLRLN
ncbi:DUF6765 family protein [Paraburkholderia caribensis]|uniref:DUF6765 family protein n=1 Tax=Paraburkholderia caribensis TaxID=75105 RepID=UPI001CB0FA0C|nr:DUF6765 family protein [Paraburkholderia caribensis]CAG9262694.1 conserved hypothetical protein [Paraburkholderia caribensis]